jgi:hypothetical protein
MEQLILKFITDRFGNYKIMVEHNHLILHDDDMIVLGVLIYARKQFNYQQYIQGSIMDMFDLTIVQVNWYMRRWVAYTFNEDVLDTDGVFGHE